MGLPGVMPTAHAQVASHPNLFVSAENSQWNNYFAGPMVVQVVVSDPNINRLDQAYGEPSVTVNGVRLRMAQATDGNWYGYFADRNQAELAGKTAPIDGRGLNFGFFCNPTTSTGLSNVHPGLDYSLTKGFTIAWENSPAGAPYTSQTGNTTSGSGNPTAACVFPAAAVAVNQIEEHVIRENKTLNGNTLGFAANSVYASIWPVIQLYDFHAIPTAVTVDYQAAGGDQIVNLTFDRIPSNLITVTPDRTAYPENANVFLTMNDPQLNIDPTEEDSWTWGASTTNNTLYYQAFDRNGHRDADGVAPGGAGALAMQNLIGNLTSFMFNHNGAFTFNPTAQNVRVVDFQVQGKQILNNTSTTGFRGDPARMNTVDIAHGSLPITFIEQGGVNTGVFGNWDGGHISNIVTLTPAEEALCPPAAPATSLCGQGSIRGQSSTFDYNEISGSIVGGFAFGSITVTATNGTWQGGTRIPVTLTDANSNKNSKITEHLNDYDPNYDRISAMKIGTPFSLDSGNPTAPPEVAFIFQNSTYSGTTGIANILPATGVTAGNNTNTVSFSPPATEVPANAGYATSTNVQTDEFYSGRPVFQFNNASTGAEQASITNGGGIFVDLQTTASTLFKTINDPTTAGIVTAKFRGFNFLNYDMRDFTTLAGATTSATAVQAYLVYANNGQPLTVGGLPNTAAAATIHAISLANSTNLEDFINLNSTFINLNSPAPRTTLNPAQASYGNPDGVTFNHDLVHQIALNVPAGDAIGLMFTFTVAAGPTNSVAYLTLGNTAKIAVAADFFSVGITGDGTQNNQRINNGIYRYELEETGDNTGVFTGTT